MTDPIKVNIDHNFDRSLREVIANVYVMNLSADKKEAKKKMFIRTKVEKINIHSVLMFKLL